MAFLLISFWYDLILCLGFVLLACYYGIKVRFSYWEKKGVYTLKPSLPFGNINDLILRKRSFGDNFYDMYKESKHIPYVGIYMVLNPTVLVNDLDLIKAMLTKDFLHFTDHNSPPNEELEPLEGHLFLVGGAKWKYLRSKLSPTFTSSKMKFMYDTVFNCSKDMSTYLEGNTGIINVKEVFACFGNDVIASCAFGIECNTFKNPNEKFRKMGKKIFEQTPTEVLLRRLDFFMPNSITRLKAMLIGKEVENFFVNVVKDTVEYREKNNIVRNDFMQLLIQLKNTGFVSDEDKTDAPVDDGTRLTLLQLAAQAFVFFVAGFETSSTTSSFALYELALNPDVQKKLAKEVDDLMAKYDGKLTYDSLAEMSYMSMVIDETLRKYPPLPVLFRLCTKDYVIPNTDVTIVKGTPVMMSVYGIHRDPDIYPNPDKFDPERFSPENKKSRHHFAHLPFGEGPRICIGNRFAMMQVKLGLATMLSKYEVSVCDKTPIPMVYDLKSAVLSSETVIYLSIKERTK